jgi:D-alanyl-D-alanine carboxypeptidase
MPPPLSSSFRLPLLPRQNDNSDFAPVPTSYGSSSSSPHPGVVAGIVVGSVGGFLLLLFLLYSCLGFGPSIWVQPSRSEYTAASQSVLSFRTRRTSRSRRHHSRGPRVTETYEVRTRESRGGGRARSRAPPPVVVDEPPVIVEPTRVPPPPRVVRSEDSEDDEDGVDQVTTASTTRSGKDKGWTIQVGAAPSKELAEDLLDKAKAKGGKVLRSADPYTVAAVSDGAKIYRARFSGFRGQDSAVNACKALKRRGISCWASLE